MTAPDLNRVSASFFSRYWVWQIEAGEEGGHPCVDELARRLPHIKTSSWAERFALGGVYLGGEPARMDSRVTPPCRLEYYEPKFEIRAAASFYPQLSPQWIVYEDDDLGVAFKPSGLPTTAPRDQQRFHLQGYLDKHYGGPIHLPSRLDTAVSGLLLFSKTSRSNRWLQKAYTARRIEKYYLCVVSGSAEFNSTTVSHPIGRDPRHPVLRAVDRREGVPAETKLTVLTSMQHQRAYRSLVQAEPLTGKTHQIRLHCAFEGYPIVGDPLYGGEEESSLYLASIALRFHHPFRNQSMTLEVPLALKPRWLQDIEEANGPVAIRYRQAKVV